MTAVADAPSRGRAAAGVVLLVAIGLASLTEAIAGTVLALGRADISGDIHATPDEFAWLDVGYTAMKMLGYLLAPWLISRVECVRLVAAATLAMGLASAIAGCTADQDALVALRVIQGLAGGILLVTGQTALFLAYPARVQPLVQALFAVGAVVAPATLAPALQGWLIDSQSWTLVFFSVVPIALMATGLLLVVGAPPQPPIEQRPLDWIGAALAAVMLVCFTYVLSQGSRWDWFEAPRMLWLTLAGTLALLSFVGRQMMAGSRGLLDFTIFRSTDFTFAFAVSFVAGAALFGSAYLIPSFAVAVLGFTPTAAGLLLLPSGALFVGALLLAGFLMQARGLPPIATVPFGIAMVMAAMWMLSGSNGESGADDMLPAILLRGFGLGFLFLSITLVAFSRLQTRNLASGIALFNTCRQLGGLMGVAGLQTLIDDGVARNAAVLGAALSSGAAGLNERIAAVTATLASKGIDPLAAGRAATSLLGRAVVGQSTVIAFDTAFNAIALLFILAAPILVGIKIGLSRFGARSERLSA
jgi:DHA2 family multidrug resistance protein